MVVTELHVTRTRLARACYLPRAGDDVASLSQTHLEWAHDHEIDVVTALPGSEVLAPIWLGFLAGSGYGCSGYGSMDGDGYGYSYGHRGAYGYGYGYGSSSGSGDEYSSSYGLSSGKGYGDGYCSGYGSGYGEDYGWGHGSYGDADGSGSGAI